MFSLRAGQTLLGLVRTHANAHPRARYCYWLGLALAAVFVAGAGVGLTRAMRDTSSPSVTSVPAASFERDVSMSPNSIVAAYGLNLATRYAFADKDDNPDLPDIQLPKNLAGTTVKVNGIPAGLFFVSPLQVNFVIPEEVMPEIGAQTPATIEITSGDGTISTGSAQISRVSPALFTANSNGKGVPSALLFRLKQNGETSYETLSERPDPLG